MAVLALDAGVLVAVERRASRASAWLERFAAQEIELVVAAPTVAEVWRDGARQAVLTRFLAACAVESVGEGDARVAGSLLAATDRCDTRDALVVAVALSRRAAVLTADPGDVGPLAEAAGIRCLTF